MIITSLFPAGANATVDFYYQTPQSIKRVSDGDVFNYVPRDSVRDHVVADVWNQYQEPLWHFYQSTYTTDISGVHQNVSFYKYLVVNMNNPFAAYLYEQTDIGAGRSAKTTVPIIGELDNRITPPPRENINSGNLAGKLNIEESSLDDFKDKYKSMRIGLYYLDPISNENVLWFKSQKVGDSGLIREPSGNSADYGVAIQSGSSLSYMLEGQYELWFYSNEVADCGGGLSGNNIVDWIAGCEGGLYGSVVFNINNDKANSGEAFRIYLSEINSDTENDSPGNGKGITEITSDSGINVDVGVYSDNTFTKALRAAITEILGMINYGIKTGGQWINSILITGNDIEDESGVAGVWKATRNMVLALLTLAIIIIAFMNILSISVEQWGLTRMLPKLILGVLMVYASFLIAAFLLDFMSALQALLFTNNVGKESLDISNTAGSILDPSAVSNMSSLGEILFLVILGLILFLVIIWLVLILIVRIAMLYILVGVAPIAFAANILPWTEKYNKMWWGSFWKWAFMGPAIAFMLWMTNMFLYEGYFSQKYQDTATTAWEPWIWLIAAAVMVFLAATLPLKMGGEVYNGVMNMGKKAGAFAGKKSGVSSFLQGRKATIDARDKFRGEKFRMGLAGKGAPKFLTGVGKNQQAASMESYIRMVGEEAGVTNLGEDKLKKLTETGSKYEVAAASLRLMDKGRLSANVDADNAEQVGKALSEFPVLFDAAMKSDKAVFSAVAYHGGGHDVTAMKTAGKAEMKDLDANQYMLLSERAPEHIVTQMSNQQTFEMFMKQANPAAKASMQQYLSETGQVDVVKRALKQSGMSESAIDNHFKSLESSLGNFTAREMGGTKKVGGAEVAKKPIENFEPGRRKSSASQAAAQNHQEPPSTPPSQTGGGYDQPNGL